MATNLALQLQVIEPDTDLNSIMIGNSRYSDEHLLQANHFFLSFSAKKGHFLQWILFCKQIKLYLIWQEA